MKQFTLYLIHSGITLKMLQPALSVIEVSPLKNNKHP